MTKILHVIIGLNKGGAELMLSRLVMSSRKNEQIIVSLTSLGKIGEDLQKNGVSVFCLNMNVWNIIFKFIKLTYMIRKLKPDVVQTWMYHSDLLGGLAAKISGVSRIVWNIRNTDIPQIGFSKTGLIIKICARLSNLIPDKIICCAYSSLDKHHKLGYSMAKMKIIPNGYDKKFGEINLKNSLIRENLGLVNNILVVGVVGRYDYLKGYDLLISAASIFSKTYNGKFVFACIGRGVDEKNLEFVKLLRDVDLQEKFLLLGERSNIEEIYSVMDFYCLPSRSEGFPNAVAEAMLCRLPCVVTDVGDASRIVDNTGIVVKSQNVESLASGLLTMANLSADNRKSLGDLARRRIIKNYEISEIVDQYFSVYKLEGMDKS